MIEKLKVLDLFSGIGGFSLGLERTGGFETIAFCEIEEFPRKVLEKHWPNVPQFEDVRKLRGADVGPVDVICGGYPCQPFSTAGKRQGQADDRHLWPEFSRLVDECRPTWIIGENVAGHISMGLDEVLSDLENKGYTCRTFIIPACAVDAKHRRDRVWIVANAGIGRCDRQSCGENEQPRRTKIKRSSQAYADPKGNSVWTGLCQGEQGGQWWPRFGDFRSPIPNDGCRGSKGQRPSVSRSEKPSRWQPEPSVGRVANGVSGRVDRLKALGNAVVPQIPEMIGRAILEAENKSP